MYLVAKKALLFVEALRPIAPCSGTSAPSAFVKFQKIVPNSLSRGNTSPRRSSRLWQVFVFCFPENSFLRNAGLSTSLPHCRQMFSGTATQIKVSVGVFSSSIPLPNHWSISRQGSYTTGPSKFQDFQGPYLQKSRTSNSQENWNNPNKPTNYVAFLLRFCKSLQLLVYFAVDFRSFFRFSFWGTPMTFWLCYLITDRFSTVFRPFL